MPPKAATPRSSSPAAVAQAEGAEILRRERAVDVVVGPQSYHRLPDMLARAGRGARVVDTEFELEDKFARLPRSTAPQVRARGPSAFLTIQEGCDKFCTFCVVPYTRGPELSRPVAPIVARGAGAGRGGWGARDHAARAENVNGYHGARTSRAAPRASPRCAAGWRRFPRLARLRYTTSHPNDLEDDLVEAHRDLPALMPFLHLPVQSGSDRILKAMNRRHTGAHYLALVEKLRAARPRSRAVVGLHRRLPPARPTPDFEATLDLVRVVGFASTFSFKYSPRPGTPGADMADQVPDALMRERLTRLQALVEAQRQAFNAATVGRTLDVLLERPGRHPGQLTGKTPYLQQVQVDGPSHSVGTIVPVRNRRDRAQLALRHVGRTRNEVRGLKSPTRRLPRADDIGEPARRADPVLSGQPAGLRAVWPI